MEISELRKLPMARECGGCTACCYLIHVKEVPTGFREMCPHVVPGMGCALWQYRPGTPKGQPIPCATYQCIWSVGFGEEEDRPDRSRVVVDLRFPPEGGEPRLYAIGVCEGDESTPQARRVMERIAEQTGQPIHLADRHLNVLEVIDGSGSGKRQ